MYPTFKFAPVDPSILPFMGVMLLPCIMGLSKSDALSTRLPASAVSCVIAMCFFLALTHSKIKQEREAGTPSQTSQEASLARRAMGYPKYALRLWMSLLGLAIPMMIGVVLFSLFARGKLPSLPMIVFPMLVVTLIATVGLLYQSLMLDHHYNKSEKL
ncbi:hypothetical protein IAD21_02210 [Abditibacteriota bacterium]|nr:hypothetical protein IAD21_02210 [Abditibacteriota bacterium]